MKKSFFFNTLFVFILGIAQASACSVKDTRVCDIDAKLREFTHGHTVTYQEASTSVPSIAAEAEWVIGGSDIVHLGDTKLFGDDELLFLIAHEYGHSLKNHGRKLVESVATDADKSLSDIALVNKYRDQVDNATEELNHQQELEADAFAVEVMHFFHKDALAAMRGVLKVTASSHSHPSRRTRLEKAKAVLAALPSEVLAANQ
jgi:hypothetical protein